MGNATLRRQVIPNLLDNALTHNIPEAGPVHLAEPFYRVCSRVGSDRPGHGPGLAIVHSIATSHRGTVTATATATGGCRR